MAGLEKASINRDEDTTSLAVSSPSEDQAKERMRRDTRDDGIASERKWTRSESPLRQLLNSSSSSRAGSPKNGSQTGGRGRGGGGTGKPLSAGLGQGEGYQKDGTTRDGENAVTSADGGVAVSSFDFVDVARHDHDGRAFTPVPDRVEPVDAVVQRQRRRQQQQQQEDICCKDLQHPLVYDECHPLSDEEQAGGVGGPSSDKGMNGKNAKRGVCSLKSNAASASAGVPTNGVVAAS